MALFWSEEAGLRFDSVVAETGTLQAPVMPGQQVHRELVLFKNHLQKKSINTVVKQHVEQVMQRPLEKGCPNHLKVVKRRLKRGSPWGLGRQCEKRSRIRPPEPQEGSR